MRNHPCVDCGNNVYSYNKVRCKRCSHLGNRLTPEVKEKIRLANSGSNNVNWKGDDVGYHQLHTWIRKRLSKPPFCADCKVNPPVDLSNISNQYKRDLSDWEWLCRRCHMTKDGRLTFFREMCRKNRNHLRGENGKFVKRPPSFPRPSLKDPTRKYGRLHSRMKVNP